MSKRKPTQIATDPNTTLSALKEVVHRCPAAVLKNPVLSLLALEDPKGTSAVLFRARLLLAERRLRSGLKGLFGQRCLSLLFAEEARVRPTYRTAPLPHLVRFWEAADQYSANKIPWRVFVDEATFIHRLVHLVKVDHDTVEKSYILAVFFLYRAVTQICVDRERGGLPRRVGPEAKWNVENSLLRFAEFWAKLPPRALTHPYEADASPPPELVKERERQATLLRR